MIKAIFLILFVKGGVDTKRDLNTLVSHLIAGGGDIDAGKVHQSTEGVARLMMIADKMRLDKRQRVG